MTNEYNHADELIEEIQSHFRKFCECACVNLDFVLKFEQEWDSFDDFNGIIYLKEKLLKRIYKCTHEANAIRATHTVLRNALDGKHFEVSAELMSQLDVDLHELSGIAHVNLTTVCCSADTCFKRLQSRCNYRISRGDTKLEIQNYARDDAFQIIYRLCNYLNGCLEIAKNVDIYYMTRLHSLRLMLPIL